VSDQGNAARRVGGGWSHVWVILGSLLVLEAILDVILLPADEVLVPGEAVGDVLYIAFAAVSMFANRPTSGRQIRTSSGRSRGVVGRGLRQNRRAAQHTWIGVVGIWCFLLVNLGLQWWFVIHHPILSVLLLPFTVIFDVIVGILCLIWTFGLLAPTVAGSVSGRDSGRQVGAER